MPVGDAARHHAPIPAEIELKMPLRGHHFMADDIQQPLHGSLETFVRPYLVQIGIGLQDMQVGVHGLVRIDVVGAQGHVFQRGEIPRKSLHITAVFPVGKMGFHHLEQVHGILEHLVVAGHFVQLRQAIDGKALGIELFLVIQALPFGRHAPIDTAVLVVAEMLQEPVPGMDGRHQILHILEGRISRGKAPDEPCVQDDAPGRVVKHSAVRSNFTVESAPRILQLQPIRQNAGSQVLPDLLQKDIGSAFH